MKVGDIFRKVLHNGTPIGGYLRVIKIEDNSIEAKRLSGVQVNVTLHKATRYKFGVCKVVKMPITHPVWDRINSGQQIAIIHDATSLWDQMLRNHPEIVEIRDVTYPQKRLLFVVDDVRECWYRRKRQVRLTLGTRLQ